MPEVISGDQPDGFLGRAKMRLRRLVVTTSVPPFKLIYAAIYQAHIRYAARRLRAIPGTRAVYVTRGAASNEAIWGVSDIDLLVMGDWPAEGQASAVKEIRRLAGISPLYDHTSTLQVHTPQSLRGLFDTDYFFQFRFDQARQCSQLAFGSDMLAALPPIPPERVRGGYYMETRVWWMQFATTALGHGPTSRDAIFRNSVSHKAVAAILNMETAMAGEGVEHSRLKAVAGGMKRLDPSERTVVERLQKCCEGRYLRYSGNVLNDAFHILLHRIEHIHALLPQGSPFEPLPNKELLIDAPAEEVFRTEAALARARDVIEKARRILPGYQNDFLLPRSSFSGIDDLQLLIETDPARPPTVDQAREICRMSAATDGPQRVAVYLLLANGAYLLDRQSPLEFWHVLQSPAANPELFNLLSRAEFVMDGKPRSEVVAHPWTLFSSTLVEDEIRLRQSAMAKAMAGGAPSSLTILRGIWRHLQLDVMRRSAMTATVYVPLTVNAVLRGMQAQDLPEFPILHELKQAYELELSGQTSRASELVPQAMALFSRST